MEMTSHGWRRKENLSILYKPMRTSLRVTRLPRFVNHFLLEDFPDRAGGTCGIEDDLPSCEYHFCHNHPGSDMVVTGRGNARKSKRLQDKSLTSNRSIRCNSATLESVAGLTTDEETSVA